MFSSEVFTAASVCLIVECSADFRLHCGLTACFLHEIVKADRYYQTGEKVYARLCGWWDRKHQFSHC